MSGIADLIGECIFRVTGISDDDIRFYCLSGAVYRMHHEQECCESISLEDVCGDQEDLIGYVVDAREEDNDDAPRSPHDDTYEWTFYIIQTQRGAVTLRWYGTSNGYYSTSVSFKRIDKGRPH